MPSTFVLSGHQIDPEITPVYKRLAAGGFSFSSSSALENVYAAISINLSRSSLPSVITDFSSYFLEGGEEISFNYTRIVHQAIKWVVPDQVNTGQTVKLTQNSGDALDVFSAPINSEMLIGPSGHHWWFQINSPTTGVKQGNFTLEVWTGFAGSLIFTRTLDIKLTATA